MKEIIIPLFIFSYVSLIMIAIGIVQYKSKKPVGFYTGETPPKAEQLTDVTAWNRKHGTMWIGYGAAIIVSFLLGILLQIPILSACFPAAVVLGGIPCLLMIHRHLKKTYFKP
ncbi:MAG: hypothetical protein IKZ09_10345 [Clostridia bacterium]|nr:hypothetical protein [Clostridia bacterium]